MKRLKNSIILIIGLFSLLLLARYCWYIWVHEGIEEHDLQELVTFVFDIISYGILIFSVYYLSRQTADVQEQVRLAKGETYHRIATLGLEIDKLFIAKPEVRKYFYGNAKIEKDCPEDKRELIESFAEYILDAFDDLIFLGSDNGIPREDLDGWKKYIKDLYDSSSILREVYKKRHYWYGKYIHDVVEGKSKK